MQSYAHNLKVKKPQNSKFANTGTTVFANKRAIDSKHIKFQAIANQSNRHIQLKKTQENATPFVNTNSTALQRMIDVRDNKGVIAATGDGKRPPGPLTGSNSQGDHMTAYVTFEHQIINAIYGQTPDTAWGSLLYTHAIIKFLPGYAETAKWITTLSDQRYDNATGQDTTQITLDDVDKYANFLLEIRNRIALTSLKTSGGSTGGQNESTHAGGLQDEERNLRNGKAKKYTKDDIMTSMMRLLDHDRLGRSVKSQTKKENIIEQHLISILDTYWIVAREYQISKTDLNDYYEQYDWTA